MPKIKMELSYPVDGPETDTFDVDDEIWKSLTPLEQEVLLNEKLMDMIDSNIQLKIWVNDNKYFYPATT